MSTKCTIAKNINVIGFLLSRTLLFRGLLQWGLSIQITNDKKKTNNRQTKKSTSTNYRFWLRENNKTKHVRAIPVFQEKVTVMSDVLPFSSQKPNTS